MLRLGLLFAVFFLCLFLFGCAPGLLYSNTTVPITKNMNRTPVGSKLAQYSSQHIRVPIGRSRISAEWNSRAIGEAAKKAGLEKIYYADLRTLSILAGTWRRESIQVWGE